MRCPSVFRLSETRGDGRLSLNVSMKKKLAFFLIFSIFLSNFFAQEDSSQDSKSDVEISSETESESVSSKDIMISVGDVFLVNMVFNSSARIFLQEEYSETNLGTMNKNLKSRWVWDEDGFFMNQMGHPYQGSLYFMAGRSNGLNFWQSFLVSASGSLFWEGFGETTPPSINDIITTPISGTILGEVLHRLFIDVYEIFPPLAWIFSPINGINQVVRNKRLLSSSHIERLDLLFHGSFEQSYANFSSYFPSETSKKFAGGGEIHIQYGNSVGHTTQEPLDTFDSDLTFSVSKDYYNLEFGFDGFLYSHEIYFENSEGTLGVNFLYEGKKSSDVAFSNGAVGAKFVGSRKFYDSEENENGNFNFFVQLDGIFMGTRSLYYLYEDFTIDIHQSNPVRSYDFCYGGIFRGGISLGNIFFGTFYANGDVSFVLPYPDSTLENAEGSKHFMATGRIGYEHKITNHFSIGISDKITYKKDWFKNLADTRQILNFARIYGKIIFERN